MLASYLLSSTFVPVLTVWLLKHQSEHATPKFFESVRHRYQHGLARLLQRRGWVILAYLTVSLAIIGYGGPRLGRSIFPVVDAGQFRLRMRAPDGTHIERTEQYAKAVLAEIAAEVGPENVRLTLGYVGMIHSNFPVNAVYQWSRGPEEAILYVELAPQLGISDEQLKERIRARLAQTMPDVRCSFEPSDIVNEVMSFGSPTPVEVVVNGPNLQQNREFAERIRDQLVTIPALRDVQFGQSLDYPTIQVHVDREKAGLAGLMPVDVSRALVTATSSSRFTVPNYWADPRSGIAYQVQVEIPRPVLRQPFDTETVDSIEALGRIPLSADRDSAVLLRDVARLEPGTMPGQFDRYNMRRQITLTANIAAADLGSVASEVSRAVEQAGQPPAGVQVEIRGQLTPMQEMQSGLAVGLGLAVVAVFLLLTANFQSLRLAFITVSTIPAVLAGVVLMLWLTQTTLNIQSFIGAIMAVGVAMANAILLVTFAQQQQRQGMTATQAAIQGAASRLRAILMTSSAMIAGMLPMALAIGQAGQQNAPLGRAVIGGLLAATAATLIVLPSMFAWIQSQAPAHSSSLDPDDAGSIYFSGTRLGSSPGDIA